MDGYASTRALVFGASGFIGRWVARRLADLGAELHLVVRPGSGCEKVFEEYSIHGKIITADLAECGAAGAVISEVRPAVIFNLAGYGVDRAETDEAAARRINTELVEEIALASADLDAGGDLGTVVVHAGSALEYGTIGGDLSEDSTPDPTTLYGATKLEGTRALARVCAETGLKGVTARLFTVYGPGEHAGRLLPSLIEAAAAKRPVELTAGLQKRDFTYVEDVAEGLARLALSGAAPGQVVNLATGRLTTVRDFTERAAAVLGIPRANLLFGAVPTRAEEQDHAPVTVARLKGLTGWTPPTGIEEGVRRTAEFLGALPRQQRLP